MKFTTIMAMALLILGAGCQQESNTVKHEVKKYKGGPVKVSHRIIAQPKVKKQVVLREDLAGLQKERNLDQSLGQRIAKYYERDIQTFQVEPKVQKRENKVFSVGPEDDAPLQIFLKPVQ